MENPEKLAPWCTQGKDKQNKNTTQYVLDITTQANTNNVNKTSTLLQTTGGKDEPNIVFVWKS
jgi:hypothetical protein